MTATRVIIYARVSTNAQEDKGTSLASQEAACREFALSRGWTVVATFSGAEGAAYRDRPNLNRVRELIRDGGCDVLLCYDLDRLTRNQTDAGILYEESETARVRWEFVRGEPFKDDPLGSFILAARAFAAATELAQKSERTIRGIEAHARNGRRMPGTHVVYGYARDGSRLQENPDTSPVVRRIFSDAVAGRSIRSIAIGLNDDGIPSPQGGRWSFSTIRLMLKNTDYTGAGYALKVSQRATRVAGRKKLVKTIRPLSERVALPDGTIEPLIDQATFDAVQVRLERNKAEATRSAKYPKETALLRTGFARCGTCGAPLQVRQDNGVTGYRCQYSVATPRPDRCPSFTIKASDLDRAVWDRVAEFLKGDDSAIEGWVDRFDPEKAEAMDDTFAVLDRELVTLAKRQASVQRQIDAMYADAGDDDLAETLTATLRAQLITTAKRHREIAQERQERARDVPDMPETIALFRELRRDLGAREAVLASLDYEQRRDVLRLLSVQAKVFPKDAPIRFEVTGRVDLTEFSYVDAWPEPMREMDWSAPIVPGSKPRLVSSTGRHGRPAS